MIPHVLLCVHNRPFCTDVLHCLVAPITGPRRSHCSIRPAITAFFERGAVERFFFSPSMELCSWMIENHRQTDSFIHINHFNFSGPLRIFMICLFRFLRFFFILKISIKPRGQNFWSIFCSDFDRFVIVGAAQWFNATLPNAFKFQFTKLQH